jgi:hypothetical protein
LDWKQLPHKTNRAVHPSLRHISAWISATGAAVAVGDLDADGYSNDLCHVDPRTDTVTVEPAPGTGNRYAPFRLESPPAPGIDASAVAPSGALIGDVNEDGRADIIVYYLGRAPVAFVQRCDASGTLGAGSFVARDLMPGVRWYTTTAFFADLNGDGHQDLIAANYYHDGARILDAKAGGVEEMHDAMARSFNGGRKHLLIWQSSTTGSAPSVKYRDAADALPDLISRGWTMAAGAVDFNDDLLPDLYLANDLGPDRLLLNRSTREKINFKTVEGTRDLWTPNSSVLGRDSFKGMGVDFADMNGDGIPDIYVSNITCSYGFEESQFLWLSQPPGNDGTPRYKQESERLGLSHSGWAWDCRLVDLNNDGVYEAVQATGFMRGKTSRWPEMQSLATINSKVMSDPRNWPGFKPGDAVAGEEHPAFFVAGKNGVYSDRAVAAGLADIRLSRGIAVADVDGDGRLDLIIANQWGDSYLLHNESKTVGLFLGLNLVMPLDKQEKIHAYAGMPARSRRYLRALGARVTVMTPDGRRLVAQVDGGSGHSGKRSQDVHFGLGNLAVDQPLQVLIEWRDRTGKRLKNTIALLPGWHTVELPGGQP